VGILHSSPETVANPFATPVDCADTSIIRTRSRDELLYTRSKIVHAAKTFRIQAIDMVCVHYKDQAYLQEECEDGRRLGFTGKVRAGYFCTHCWKLILVL